MNNQLTAILQSSDYAVDDSLIARFQQGLAYLKTEFDAVDDELLNDDHYREHLADAVDLLLQELGYDEFDTDAYADLLFRIYQVKDYSDFMVFVAIAFQTVCDDENVLADITHQVKNEVDHYHDHDFDDHDNHNSHH